MKYEEAPVYVEAYDLAAEVLRRTARFPKNQRFVLARRMEESALDLLDGVTVALLDPSSRTRRLAEADLALTRLRVAARLARDLNLLGSAPAVALGGRMASVGRQLGGLRRHGEPPLPK